MTEPLLITCLLLFNSLAFITLIMASILANRYVSGSRLRYLAVTVVITLAWPITISSAFMVLVSAAQQEMLDVIANLMWGALSYFNWRQFKNDDNWWNGRGKKWLQSLDKALARLSRAPATG